MKDIIVRLPAAYVETLIRILDAELDVLSEYSSIRRDRAILRRLYAAQDKAKKATHEDEGEK